MHSVRVAVAVISNENGEILLTKRAKNKHLGGLWEFPGGKCEYGETAYAALIREIREELEVEVIHASPLICIPYQYPELHVQLEVFRVTAYSGTPRGAEGQPLKWGTPERLNTIALPAANRPIVKAIQLPSRYLITPALDDVTQLYHGAMTAATKQDIELIQLRAPTLPTTDYLQLSDKLLRDLPYNAKLLVKGTAAEIAALPNVGWHLTSTQLRQLNKEHLPQVSWLAASCHNAEELELASKLGCDFVTLSPVLATASHPESTPIGFTAAREITAGAQLPVYWLGGLQNKDIETAQINGAQGVAAIRGFWPL